MTALRWDLRHAQLEWGGEAIDLAADAVAIAGEPDPELLRPAGLPVGFAVASWVEAGRRVELGGPAYLLGTRLTVDAAPRGVGLELAPGAAARIARLAGERRAP